MIETASESLCRLWIASPVMATLEVTRVRDIIRAKVLESEPAIQLTTKSPGLGVLKSYCPRCGTPMNKKGHGVVCPECEWKDSKKLADDYGTGNLL